MKRPEALKLTAGVLFLIAAFGCDRPNPTAPSDDIQPVFAVTGAPVEYEAISLGTLGGGYSHAYAMNDHGQVVGYSQTAGGEDHAFLWENGLMIDLGTLGGDSNDFSRAEDINNQGQIVGYSRVVGGEIHAFLWEDGVMTDIGGTPGAPNTWAYSINELGDVAGWGYYYTGEEYEAHAYLWADGQITSLGHIGGHASWGWGINDHAQVVGYAQAAGEEVLFRAFLWENGVMTDLGTLGGIHSQAHDINNHGQVAGFSYLADGYWRGVLWEDGEVTVLGHLGGGSSEARGINDRGQVVGYSYASIDGTWRVHAFLWEEGEMADLGTLDGYTTSEAWGINNLGQVVGISQTEAGNTEGTLWTVVDPVAQMGSLVEELAVEEVLNDGQANSLLSKLDNFARALASDRPSAPKILGAFINEVEAHINAGILTAEEGQPLIDIAQALIDQLTGG